MLHHRTGVQRIARRCAEELALKIQTASNRDPVSRNCSKRPLARAAGRAARRSIHARAGAAAQHRPYTHAQSTEGGPSRRGSAGVSGTAGTMYSRVRRFGSPDAVVLDPPDPAHYLMRRGQPLLSTARRLPSVESTTRLSSESHAEHVFRCACARTSHSGGFISAPRMSEAISGGEEPDKVRRC
jgi:hypothetical protein